MKWLSPMAFLVLVSSTSLDAPTSDPANEEAPPPPDEIEECQEGVKGLREGIEGLEFFLQDKRDKKRFCPNIRWEQPKLEKYKKKPMSYLPESCIK